ncbi:hypothetical protein UCREL1_2530 [Eutypa lata UCREL1]|uniref:Uncharacterized protein n=1 Tax=Eutypa lata (strain UCR-EL1) TaxID=1287681 RepID=M7T0S5_EUTLA|nr:hypothetical protein UCREL1_2530 [Eutypa lata UCREL1]
MPPRRHHILQGCCDEAERADVVSRNLQSLRNALPDSLHPHLDGVIYELGVTGRHLRDIADKAQVQIGRVPQILDYLNIVLPCLCKTLRDITAFYEDTTLTKDRRWRYMYHRLGNELPGTTLPARFIMYNQFLNLLRMMLSHNPEMSEAYGPLKPLGQLGSLSPDAKNLVTRRFDNDRLSIIFFLKDGDQAPFIYIRIYMQPNEPWVATIGVHELVIKRDKGNDSALVLSRWCLASQKSKPWARLQFNTWEEMVLFHCTFVTLKADSPRLVNMDPDEYKLRHEELLFKAHIIDDGFTHLLSVFEDQATKGLRLHAAVIDDALHMCPVWTAFIEPQPAMIRKSRHRIWLRDLQPYVFCDRYSARRQRKGKADAFELYFVHEEAATRFKQAIGPPINTATESSDNVTVESDI